MMPLALLPSRSAAAAIGASPARRLVRCTFCRAISSAAPASGPKSAHSHDPDPLDDTKSAEDSSANLEGFNLSCVDNVFDPSVEIGTQSVRRKINGSCGSSTKA